MEFERRQRNFVADVTESIYSVTITARENKLRANMRRLREMLFVTHQIEAASLERATLSGCLWFAVLDRDAAAVAELLTHKPDVNLVRDDLDMLWMSLARGDINIAKMLVESGANVNSRRRVGVAPSFLHFLLTKLNSEDCLILAEMMIERDADVNANFQGYSVLQVALMHEAVTIVRQLLRRGAQFKPNELIPLVAAQCSDQSAEMLTMLVDSIDDAEQRLVWAFGSLQHLIAKGDENVQAIKAMLHLHPSVLNLEIDGWTILRAAENSGQIQMVSTFGLSKRVLTFLIIIFKNKFFIFFQFTY